MWRLSCCGLAVLLGCAAASLRLDTQKAPVNPDAQVLAAFNERIKEYVELHKGQRKDVPPLEETDDPGKILEAQQALAAKMRTARAGARRGDIFTPEAAQLFRRLLTPETKGTTGAETRRAITEDAPSAISLKINASYPEDEPLPTVPPNVLASLPPLPEELEYRIVRNHLILRDVPANLIVDYIPNVMR